MRPSVSSAGPEYSLLPFVVVSGHGCHVDCTSVSGLALSFRFLASLMIRFEVESLFKFPASVDGDLCEDL